MALAESKIKVTTFMRQLLLENSEIVALTGKKIYPVVASKDTKGDLVVYQRTSYSKDRSNMGVSRQTAQVCFNVISDDYDRCQHIAYLIDKCLDGTFKDTDNPSLSTTIHLIDSSEDYEDGKYIQILLFEIS